MCCEEEEEGEGDGEAEGEEGRERVWEGEGRLRMTWNVCWRLCARTLRNNTAKLSAANLRT